MDFKEMAKTLYSVAALYGVELKCGDIEHRGKVSINKDIPRIVISNKLVKAGDMGSIVFVFFHELGHVIDQAGGKFRPYYINKKWNKLTEHEARAFLRCGVGAENHATETGRKVLDLLNIGWKMKKHKMTKGQHKRYRKAWTPVRVRLKYLNCIKKLTSKTSHDRVIL